MTTGEVTKPCDLSSRLSAVEKKGVKEDGAEQVMVLVHHDSVCKWVCALSQGQGVLSLFL